MYFNKKIFGKQSLYKLVWYLEYFHFVIYLLKEQCNGTWKNLGPYLLGGILVCKVVGRGGSEQYLEVVGGGMDNILK